MVCLKVGEDSAAAERVAVAVDEPSGRTRIFELVRLGDGEYLRLADAGVGMFLHKADEWLEPPFAHLYVGVQEHVVVGVNLLEGPVVAACEAVVLVELDPAYAGIVLLQPFQRAVGGSVVGYHYEGPFVTGAFDEGGEILPEHLQAVPVENDNSGIHRASFDEHPAEVAHQRKDQQQAGYQDADIYLFVDPALQDQHVRVGFEDFGRIDFVKL